MLITVDSASLVGLADQIAAQLRGQIADGLLGPGERLAPARQVAAGLGVNMHTVLRAYQLLRDDGLIELRRGRGAVVAEIDPGEVGLDGLISELATAALALGWTAERAGQSVVEAMRRLAEGDAAAEIGGRQI